MGKGDGGPGCAAAAAVWAALAGVPADWLSGATQRMAALWSPSDRARHSAGAGRIGGMRRAHGNRDPVLRL